MEKEKDFERFVTLIIDELHAVEGRLTARMDKMDGRMDKMDGRMSKMEIDISEIKDQLRNIWLELRDINGSLDLLEEKVGGMGGYAKEIDELRTRVKVIEEYMRKNVPITA